VEWTTSEFWIIDMRRILLVIPISAGVIAGLVAFKLTRHYAPPSEEIATVARATPLFKLEDQHSQIVRLEAYVGRHKLLIVFYDGSQGPERSVLLTLLRNHFPDLQAAGAVVLAISAARPSQNRYGLNLERRQASTGNPGASAADGELRYPFPVLSDVRDYQVHRQYGAYDEQAQQPREAVFVVDRAGLIQRAHFGPAGLGQIDDWIKELRNVR
jgi:peroxiredoxin